MGDYESWETLYCRLYSGRHLSELSVGEMDVYYECIIANHQLINGADARAQNIEDACSFIMELREQDSLQTDHLRFLVRLAFWVVHEKQETSFC